MAERFDVPSFRLGLTDFASLLGLSKRHVRTLVKEGWIPESDDEGTYSVPAGVQGALRAKDAKSRETSASASVSRVQDARAREIEIKIAERENRLVDIDDAIGAMDEVVGAVKSKMSGVPARCTNDLALRSKIESEIGQALNAAADMVASQASALRAGGEAPSLAGGDDA